MRAIIALLLAATPLAALAGPGLTPANYVATGDTIVDMLDTSTLAFSTMLLGLNDTARPRRAAFTSPAARVQPFSAPCPAGGSVSGSIADRDGSGDLSVRDRFVTVFDACRIDDEVISGSSEFVIVAHRIADGVETTELAFRFRQLGNNAMRWHGAAHASLRSDARTGSEQYAVTYQDLVVTRGARAWRWNFTLTVQRPPLGDHTARIGGRLGLGDDALQLAQDEAFVIGPRSQPRSGQLTATDAEGDRLEVEAVPRRYRYRFFTSRNRSDAPDSTSQSLPHAGR